MGHGGGRSDRSGSAGAGDLYADRGFPPRLSRLRGETDAEVRGELDWVQMNRSRTCDVNKVNLFPLCHRCKVAQNLSLSLTHVGERVGVRGTSEVRNQTSECGGRTVREAAQ